MPQLGFTADSQGSLGQPLLCGLYVATGSLLVPIVLHMLIDARIALLPPLNEARSQALPA